METMTTTAAETTGDFINITARDWEGARKVHLDDVSRETTVGQVVGESVRALKLPFRDFYQAVFRGRELNHSDTVREAGLDADSEIELVPEVSAGSASERWMSDGWTSDGSSS
jgi:phosphoribosylaminoimidazole-succinocarboxamide synthase